MAISTRRRGVVAAVVVCLVAAMAPGGPVSSSASPTATPSSGPVGATHLDVELLLHTSTTRGLTSSDADLVAVDDGVGAVPASRGARPTPQDVLIVGRDGSGTEQWRTLQPDPREQRAESPDAEGHLSGETIARPDAPLSVAVPDDLGIAELQLSGAGLDATVALPTPPPALEATAVGDQTVDIAVLGDGYTAAQQTKFSTDVDTVMAGFFADDPFAEYESYFQINKVPVVSAQSGADHLETSPQTFRNIALGAEYGCFDIDRLICVDESAVGAKLAATLTPAQYDIVLVLVNDTVYGGSGGIYAVASMDEAAVELVLHELGHSFGGLVDEYFGNGNDPSCVTPANDEVNVTSRTNRAQIPWSAWIAGSTPVPTPGSTPGLPGSFLGGRFCAAGVYRPTYDSKMRTLERPWDPVNQEQLVRRIYDRVPAITQWSPAGATLTPPTASLLTFTIGAHQPASGPLDKVWTLDGEPIGTAAAATITAADLPLGSHEIVATVSDPTPFVRSDPDDLLIDTHTWWIADVRGPFASWGAAVDSQYLDLLGRPPTSSERAFWTQALAQGTADRGDLADWLRRSPDNTANVDPTARLYRAFLQRRPDVGGLRYWVGRKRSGAWTLARMADYFAASSEFVGKYGQLTNRAFVTRIYTDVLGRTADPSGVDYWTRQLDLRRRSRGSVMIGFSESTEYRRQQAENTDVAVAIIFLLGRTPTAAEISTWVSRQKAGTRHEDLLIEVLASDAYAQRHQ